MTMILRCTCKHDYQDTKYGRGMRVHNKTSNDDFRCTVCKSNRTGKSGSSTKSKGKKSK